jgi:phospholipid/cholesterol/gamma-HCH transport system substrate-binding protein
MKFSIRFADQIVGALVILALAILVFVIFMLGRSQRWFTRDHLYVTYFSSASGLSNNMDIKYKGFTIGHVKKFELKENDTVEVTLSIFEEHSHRVTEGSLVEVSVSPIGLGNSFVFYPGRGSGLIEEGGEIPEVNSVRGRQIIAAGMVERAEASDGIGKIIGNVNTLLENINIALAVSEGEESPVLRQIMLNLESATREISGVAQTLRVQIYPILDNLETVTDQLSDPSGTLMAVLGAEGSLYSNLTSVIESLSGIVKNLERTSEFLPAQLPQINVIISDLNGVIRTAQGVLASIENNPLFKGGIPEHREIVPGAASPRNMEF